MKIGSLRRNWEQFGAGDAFYAVLADEDKRDGEWDVEEFFALGKAEIAELMRYVDAVGGCARRSALDFGSGLGRLTQALAEYFEVTVGVDIASSMIERATALNRMGDRCTFKLNTSADLSLFEAASFDLIYTSAVLQHMEPRYARCYIQEFFRITRLGGLIAFQLPDPLPYQGLKLAIPESVLAFQRVLRGRTGPVMQMFGISQQSVEAVVRASGGEILEMRPKDSGPGHPGRLYVCRKAE